MTSRRRFLSIAAASLPPGMARWGAAQAQAVPTIRIARIQGINFLPTYLMQRRNLIEQQAARLGLPDARVEWVDFGSSAASVQHVAAMGAQGHIA